MRYTLITKNGKIMQFYIKDVAELYQQINGGVVLTQQILDTVEKYSIIDWNSVMCYNIHIVSKKDITMFESIEIRKAANGFILVVATEDDSKEYVYDTSRKAMRVIKQYLEADTQAAKIVNNWQKLAGML